MNVVFVRPLRTGNVPVEFTVSVSCLLAACGLLPLLVSQRESTSTEPLRVRSTLDTLPRPATDAVTAVGAKVQGARSTEGAIAGEGTAH